MRWNGHTQIDKSNNNLLYTKGEYNSFISNFKGKKGKTSGNMPADMYDNYGLKLNVVVFRNLPFELKFNKTGLFIILV